MQKFCFTSIIALCFFTSIAQLPVASYGFNNCTGEEDNTLLPGVKINGTPSCVCGPEGMTYRMGDVSHSLEMPSLVNQYFDNDFTLSFYFTNQNTIGESYIMYNGKCNSVDSLIRLRYFSDTDDYLFEVSSNVNNFHSMRFEVDNSKCWHNITVSKFKLEYFLYVDFGLVARFVANETIRLPKNEPIFFATNPCGFINSVPLNGSVDEISFTPRALSPVEIKAKDLNIGRIVNQSQAIFAGEEIELAVGQACGNITWSPSTVIPVTGANVKANPIETTQYIAQSDDAGCISLDSVIIFVANRDSLDCKNLLLPSAFTPNGDGLNDSYGISNKFIVEKLEYLEIYARNGALIWETNDITQSWNGIFDNNHAPGGTYVYKAKYVCKGQEFNIAKTFVLLK
jgi:gliding motility-associated-like protein